ncbi:MAG: oxidoreductase [Lachnospiraceae bacterium]|nr:oxidoreductase [Lachnospiraceae bacterium]
MSCCLHNNLFEDSLHYSSPAHGGWGVLKMGQLVPESYQLFVSPAACGRHGALAARMEDRKNRVSYVFLSEADIVSGGYEDTLIQSARKLLAHLKRKGRMPKVLMIFVSCIDDLLGTDHDALIMQLSEEFPDVRFTFAHMNPTSTDTGVPPAVNIQNKDYALLDRREDRDCGVNLIGNLAPIKKNSELFTVLHEMGASVVRHISDYATFIGYQEMAKSKLNLVLAPTGKYASTNMEKKLGIPFEMALTSFQIDCIKETYERIAKQLGVSCPDFTAYEEECRAAMERAAQTVGDMEIIIDGETITRPFDLAKSLLEAGMKVKCVYQQKVLPSDKANFEWVRENYPEILVLQPQHPRTTISEKFGVDCLSIGFSAAYISGAKHVLDIAGQHGLYGFQGIIDLMKMIEEASQKEVELKKLLEDTVLVV